MTDAVKNKLESLLVEQVVSKYNLFSAQDGKETFFKGWRRAGI